MRRHWTDAEVRKALTLYLRLEFGKFHSRQPDIIALAREIGRTPSAVALKLANLAALDDSLPQKGMQNASALDRKIWEEFLRTPDTILDYAAPLASFQNEDPVAGFAERQARFEQHHQQEPTALVRQRRGQAFFREMILTSYKHRCALSGIEDQRLLTASHIVGWAEDHSVRLNPQNGICLNALHDRAFDRHLISFDEDYRLIIAQDVPSEPANPWSGSTARASLCQAGFYPARAFSNGTDANCTRGNRPDHRKCPAGWGTGFAPGCARRGAGQAGRACGAACLAQREPSDFTSEW